MTLLADLRAQHQLTRPRLVARSKKQEWVKYSRQLWEILKSEALLIVSINGVATFYYETCLREYWDLGRRDHFPDLTPPRSAIWFEYRIPERIRSEAGDRVSPIPNGRAGVLLLATDPENAVGYGIPEHSKVILSADVFLDYGLKEGEIQGPHGAIIMAIDAEGRIIGVPFLHTFTESLDREAQEEARFMVNWLHPPLLALSWLPREIPEDQTMIEL